MSKQPKFNMLQRVFFADGSVGTITCIKYVDKKYLYDIEYVITANNNVKSTKVSEKVKEIDIFPMTAAGALKLSARFEANVENYAKYYSLRADKINQAVKKIEERKEKESDSQKKEAPLRTDSDLDYGEKVLLDEVEESLNKS